MDLIASWLTLLSFGDRGWSDELVRGAGLSLGISISAYIIGLLIGLAGALAKLSNSAVAKGIAAAYTTLIRSIPDIVLIFLVYYTATDAIRTILGATGLMAGFEMNGFVAAAISLGIVQGGYSTEVLRGAIIAVAPGQSEAAYALGLRRRQVFLKVVMSQMVPLALPGLGNLWLVVLKESSLVSLIGFTELVLAGKMAAGATRHYFLFYTMVALIFLIMSAVSTVLLHFFEARSHSAWRPR
jgi:polar amino acid transport system permease protein